MRYTNNKQNGNVLFLILIAVALFAALSYAVTSSTRGGGNANKEAVDVDLSAALGHIAFLASELQKYEMFEGDIPELTTNAGGLYESGQGVPIMHPPLSLASSLATDNTFTYVLSNAPVSVGGNDLGTSAADLLFSFGPVTQEACELFNEKELGSSTLPGNVGTAAGTSEDVIHLSTTYRDNTPNTFVFNSFERTFPETSGCFGSGSTFNIYVMISER